MPSTFAPVLSEISFRIWSRLELEAWMNRPWLSQTTDASAGLLLAGQLGMQGTAGERTGAGGSAGAGDDASGQGTGTGADCATDAGTGAGCAGGFAAAGF